MAVPSNGAELHVATDANGVEIFRYDATTQITEHESGTFTKFPIETGGAVADHYQNLPLLITLSGVYTDDPSLPSKAKDSASGFIGSRSENGRELLRSLKRRAEIFTVRTQRGTTYENMIILDWQDTKTAGTGATFRPTIRLEQTAFATAETTLIPNVGGLENRTAENVRTEERSGASGDSETGRQSPTEAEEEDLAPLRRAFGGILGV